MSQAKLREALVSGASTKDKGPPVADGFLTVTPDTAEAIEWRSRESVIEAVASSSTFLDDEGNGHLPSSLYGKFTWELEKFSELSKRELRSATFHVGQYKWYILVYPQGCDVTNHLSLFLCVADYDKLLPGWGHFAQFTIAVVNPKDPRKSKYSDTLHRFCKKEHDWGWKKFMELSKMADGFTTGDSLIIKAQVQVIPDRPPRPCRTLDAQYRRELVRVYLSNVEGIVRRFVDEKRDIIGRLVGPSTGFKDFWGKLGTSQRAALASAPAPTLLKDLVKRFFNEKEVTSTLVMDALYCGAKELESMGRIGSTVVNVVINATGNKFCLPDDVVPALERLANDPIPPLGADKTSETSSFRMAQEGDDYSGESVERDERHLIDLGRRTVEMFAAAYLIETQMEVAWVEAETIKRQEELIREEEEAERGEAERAAARAEAEKERRARKKERQRAKKEAERAKKEAEIEEQRRQEEERRAEAERHRREAEEKKRREEEEREVERQNQLAIGRESARRVTEAAARAMAKQTSKPCSPRRKDLVASMESSDLGSPGREEIGTLDSSRSDGSIGSTVRTAGVHTTSHATCHAVGIVDAPTAFGSPEFLYKGESTHQQPVLGGAFNESETVILRNEVASLAAQCAEKDAVVAALRVRVAELESQLAVYKAAAGAAYGSRPGSSQSHKRSESTTGSEATGSEAPSPAKIPGLAPTVLGNGSGAGVPNGQANRPGLVRPQSFGGAPSGGPTSSPSDAILATASGAMANDRRLGATATAAASLVRQASAPGPVPAPHALCAGVNPPSRPPNTSHYGAGGGMTGHAAPSYGSVQVPYASNAGGGAVSTALGPPKQPSQMYGQGYRSGSGNVASTGPVGMSPGMASHLPGSESMPHMSNGGTMFGQQRVASAPPQNARAFSSPLPGPVKQRLDASQGPMDSPGLDDFAHMGLINDLLE